MLKQVTFPDGTTVWGGGTGVGERPQADFGLYLDEDWMKRARRDSSSVATEMRYVRWEDFGVPDDKNRAAKAIVEAFGKAQDGKRVEVLCAGGTGRTGTVLSCMAVLSRIPGDESVKWVRQNYLERAVETPEQADFVAWFAANFGPRQR
jgi:hypothetical protein